MNQFFVVYDPNTGKVWRTGSCEAADVPHQAGPEDHEMFMEASQHYDANTIRVDLATGQIVPKE
jgi:hypothetical protein